MLLFAGGSSSLQSKLLDKGHKRHLEDPEMAVDALDSSCIVRPAKEDGAAVRGQSQDGSKGQCNTKNNNRWKWKIRATFPLIFNKHRNLPQDKEGPETVPEAECDVEEVVSADSKTSADTENPSEGSYEAPAVMKSVGNPRKRLALSLAQKEKLVNLDVDVKPEESPINGIHTNPAQHADQEQTEVDKPERNSGQNGAASSSAPSALQIIANAFRRTFNGSSNTAVVMRPKRDGPRKQRPMSEGAFSFTSLFGSVAPASTAEERRASMRDPRWASVDADPWGAGQDLPSLLQQVSLKSRRDSEDALSNKVGSLSRKRVDLFSSLRLRKRELSDVQGRDQEVQNDIKTILSNLRNKASSQQKLEEMSSSDDENDKQTSSLKLSSEKLVRKQEKTVAQQAKREQLKRLHRAQVIQRQLEEVGEKQRGIEERGVAIEKIIRGETDSPPSEDSDEAQLYQSWFRLVLEKNRLSRYESELMIFAQELELEDTQSRLQQDLRRRMTVEDTKKSASELQEEQEILAEIMRTVEKRDMLVSILDEQRLKERAEDKDLESLVLSKGYEFHWAQGNDSWTQEKLE